MATSPPFTPGRACVDRRTALDARFVAKASLRSSIAAADASKSTARASVAVCNVEQCSPEVVLASPLHARTRDVTGALS